MKLTKLSIWNKDWAYQRQIPEKILCLKSDVAPGPHELKLWKAQKKTNKIELRYDLILYPQRYVGNLKFVSSTVT